MNQALLDDADRIVATDLYPARCRTVIAALAAALRSMSTDLAESRTYGLALEAEMKARAALAALPAPPGSRAEKAEAERDRLAAQLAKAQAREAALRGALRKHHEWHLSQDMDGNAWGIDPVDAYSESGLCEETCAALATHTGKEGAE